MTPSQAARFLGVTRQTIYSRVLRGELRAERVGAHMRIARGVLEGLKQGQPGRRT